MQKSLLNKSKNLPYHVTGRTFNRECFSLPLKNMWELSQESLVESCSHYQVRIVSFVLMSNHYHLLLYTPNGDLESFIDDFNLRLEQKTQKIISKWFLIMSFSYFKNCYRYVYQNPVRSGVVNKSEDYNHSTLKNLVEINSFGVPLFDKFGFKDKATLLWINGVLDEGEINRMRGDLCF